MKARPPTSAPESLTFVFENEDAKNHFWSWLCESGEQQYWEYMEYREQEEEGDITGLDFDYSNADRGTVVVKCGRFTAASESEQYTENDEEV
ncbi:MAG: hypothetical protein JO112_20075 [Planctomycetes bacterium]|nr:hypothetical protein [Planctomycetota bacterium]